jgi:RNA polymerase sigma factor (sigma-70 family)
MNYNEIESCVIRAKAGSKKDLLKLLQQFKPFIFKTAKQFNIKNYDSEDLLQVGYTAIIKAVAKYKIGSHTFSSYAYNAVKNTLIQTARNNSKYSGELSLNSPVQEEEDNTSEYLDCISSEVNLEEEILKNLEFRELRSAIKNLSEEEEVLVYMLYYARMTLKTYSVIKDISYSQALRKRDSVLKKLRKYLASRQL